MKIKLLAFVLTLVSLTTVSTAFAGGPGGSQHGGHSGAGTGSSPSAGRIANGHGTNDVSHIGGGKSPDMRQAIPPKRDFEKPIPNKPERHKIDHGNGEHRPGSKEGLGPSGLGPNTGKNAGPKHGPSGDESKKSGGGSQAGGSHAGGKSDRPKAGPNSGVGTKRG